MIPQYIAVQIQTKKNIKAFLESNFGTPVKFDRNCIFHNPLILCLSRDIIQHTGRVGDYPVSLKLHIPVDMYERHGCYMSAVQMKFFNLIVEQHMKLLLISYADTYLHMTDHANLRNALQYAMDVIRVSEDDWEYDSIKRFYHRYRIRNNKPLIYKKEPKTFGETVPSENLN